MRKNSWYLSMWFIAIMFALWFLILPLILGIVLISKFNKEKKESQVKLQEKSSRLLELENEINDKELKINRLVLQKQKDLSLLDFAKTIKLVSKLREKEGQLDLREDVLIKKEQEIEAKITQHNSIVHAKENELFDQKYALFEREKVITELVAQKQKELSLIDFAQSIRMIPKIREKEEELKNREIEIHNREHDLEEVKREICILEKKKINLEDEVLLQSFGFYDNKFFFGKFTGIFNVFGHGEK